MTAVTVEYLVQSRPPQGDWTTRGRVLGRGWEPGRSGTGVDDAHQRELAVKQLARVWELLPHHEHRLVRIVSTVDVEPGGDMGDEMLAAEDLHRSAVEALARAERADRKVEALEAAVAETAGEAARHRFCALRETAVLHRAEYAEAALTRVREAIAGLRADADRYRQTGDAALQQTAAGYRGAIARIESALDGGVA